MRSLYCGDFRQAFIVWKLHDNNNTSGRISVVKKKDEVKYQLVATASLIPYARNAKKHSEKQATNIASSIKEFGFINPAIIDRDNGIIAGHGRVLAAQKLGMEMVPCLRVEHLTETQKRAYILADNRLAEQSEWDNELLKIELDSLKESDFDFDFMEFDSFKLDDNINPIGMPELSNEGKKSIQQMTFTLHDNQAETVKQAIEKSKKMGEFWDTGNENSNGNALARICEMFL